MHGFCPVDPSPGRHSSPGGVIFGAETRFEGEKAHPRGLFWPIKETASMVDTTSDHARLEEELGPRPRLILRFALHSGLVLLAAGLAIFWAVNREIAHRAERTLQSQARAIAQDSLSRRLQASDFARPVSGPRRAELDRIFREDILIPGVVGARLVNRNGTITYAALHRLIGTRVLYAGELAGVLEGRYRRHVTHTVSWRGKRNIKV